MDLRDRGALWLLCALAAATLAFPFLDRGSTESETWYDAIAISAVLLGALGLRRRPRAERRVWGLVLLGYAGWVFGDLVFALEIYVLELDFYPVPSDAVYLASYVVLAVGINRVVSRFERGPDTKGILDAAIVAAGTTILAVVFVVAPLAADSSLSLAAKVTSAAYPFGDVLLLAMLVRLWTVNGRRTVAFHLLVVSVVLTLVADGVWTVLVLVDGGRESAPWTDAMWLGCYIAAAAAMWIRGADDQGTPSTEHESLHAPRGRIVLLAGGLVLPALALLLDGAGDGTVMWLVVGIGSLVLSGLVLARMAGLLGTITVQSAALEQLARSDALTGAPNRRTWDFELLRACEEADAAGALMTVAILDLDHFKVFNDTYGHQAGDLLLRDTVASWRRELDDGELLARYGGEEFALLLPARTAEEASRLVHQLRESMPAGQTFSAGVAQREPGDDPSEAVARADAAMYEAKRAGRDRVVLAAP